MSTTPSFRPPTLESGPYERAERRRLWLGRRWLGRRWLVAAIVGISLTALVSSSVAPVAATEASAEESIAKARAEQRQLEDEELQAKAHLDAADAEYFEMEQAWEAAQLLVQRKEADVSAAQVELAAAELRQRQILVSIQWAEYDLGQLEDAATELAVQAYLGETRAEGSTLLQSTSVQDGVTKLAILDLATNKQDDVIEIVRGLRESRTALEDEQMELVSAVGAIEAALQDDLAALEEHRELAEELRDEVSRRVTEWQNRIDEVNAADDELEEFIRRTQETERQRIERERQEAEVAAGRAAAIDRELVTTGDGWAWPTAGRVGSVFGPRLHPILGYYRPHNGLDIGGAHGAGIYAADSGTVILAGVNGGYGNTIVIDHGASMSSLYAHQSRFHVSKGSKVEKGDLIGYVGTTGLSTGPHLHFEARLNGAPIDPMPLMQPRR